MKRIYDIGANIGKFTELNIDKYKNCEFILIEANPNLIPILEKKFENFKNVKVLNLCISDLDGFIDFYISEVDTISTASTEWIIESRFSGIKYNHPLKIKSTSIDSIINEFGKSDYIKIDVEGYEHVVIRGIKKYIGLISFEWAEEMIPDIKKSLYYLNSIGYTKFHITYNDNYTFIPETYTNYDDLLSEIDNNLDYKRKEKWGMIFLK